MDPELIAALTPALADELAALQRRSYAVEAALMGVDSIPPMRETPEDLAGGGRAWLLVRDAGVVVAALSFKDLEDGTVDIYSVTVDPEHFRRGLATTLLDALDALRPGARLTLMTGNRNVPARTLYEARGFTVVRRQGALRFYARPPR